MNRLKRILRKGRIPIVITAVVALLFMLSPINVAINPPLGNISEDALTIGQNQIVLTIGTDVYAAGTADYTCDGVADDIQFQAALNALPVGGGKLVVLTGNYVFAATVSRAIDDVTIDGMGDSTYFAFDAGTALFDAGVQDGWVFRNFRTDIGGVDVTGTQDYVITNVTVGTDIVGKITRTATFVVAASDSSDSSKAQADYVCDGVDDQVEIQAAIDALPAPGGLAQLSEGTFNASGPLDAVSNLTLRGQGKHVTTIVQQYQATADGMSLITLNSGVHNCEFSDFGLDCNIDGVAVATQWWYHNGIATLHEPIADPSQFIVIKDVSIKHSQRGAGGYQAQGWQILNCYFEDCRDVAINLDHGSPNPTSILGISNKNLVIGNYVNNTGFSALIVDGGGTGNGYQFDAIVSQNHLKGSVTLSGLIHAILSGNIIDNGVNDAALNVNNSSYIQFLGGTIYGTAEIVNSRFIDFVNVHAYSNGGIYLHGNVQDVLFQGGLIGGSSVFGSIYNKAGETALRIKLLGVKIKPSVAAYAIAAWGNIAYSTFENNDIDDVNFATTSSANAEIGDVLIKLTTVSDAVPGTKIIITYDDVSTLTTYIERAFTHDNWVLLSDALTKVATSGNVVTVGAASSNMRLETASTNNRYRNNRNLLPSGPGVALALQYESHSDLFMDVLAVSATGIRSNEDLNEAIPNTFTLTTQPDVPRTLSGHFDTHAQITAYTIVITGVDGKGNTVTETFTEAASPWDFETSNAYAIVTSIIMTARTGTGAGDTMDIGITDVLGLSNVIYEAADVYKIKKDNANVDVAGAQVDTDYDTYDMSVITLAATDDFTIWYRSNLNIIN